MSFNEKPIYRPICQVQREILFYAEKLPDSDEKAEIIARVNEALRMSKRMDHRLKELSPHYNATFWLKDHTQGREFEPFEPGSRENAG